MIRLAALALAGCAVTYEPDVGALFAQPGDGGTSENPACADSDPGATVSFALHVRPLTTRSPGGCLFCHGATTTSGFSLGSYESLRRGGQNSGSRIVVPRDPCSSVLYQKLSPTPPFGSRMPYNGPPYFSAAELTTVRDWIAEGALDN